MRPEQPKREHAFMDLDEFRRIVREMVEAGVQEIGLFYLGESLMNGNLTIDACKVCKEEGVEYVFLTTNGSRCFPWVSEGLFKAGLDSLKFSINCYDENQFSEVVGVSPKYFKASLQNLRRATQIRDNLGASCKISASSIRYDGEQLEKMQLVVDEISQYLTGPDDSHYWLPLYSMGAVATEREEELGYKPTAGNQGRIGGLVQPIPCWSLFSEGHVRVDSGFSLCCFDADSRFHVASLKDMSFMDVWHHPDFQRVRQAHLDGDLSGTVCEQCVAYS
jgi:MoaA/NifB/PqqE/SkfB family radical SAM enzyme